MPTVPDAHDNTPAPALVAPRDHHPSPPRVSLLDADRELCAAVPEASRRRAREALLVPGCEFDPGGIDLPLPAVPETAFALLVVHGSLVATTRVGTEGRMIELLSEGDLVMPFAPPPAMPSSRTTVTATEKVLLAPLDRPFLRAAALWPELMVVVQRRLHEQQHRLSVHAAICRLPRVEQRLMGMMWHLADRFGTVSADGIILARPLNHRALAELVGAQRPTVSIALKGLQERGQLRRRRDGTWILPSSDGTFIVGLER
jgi:CRP/FNR family transcriptional regulator, cyclic AMP receptor protein